MLYSKNTPDEVLSESQDNLSKVWSRLSTKYRKPACAHILQPGHSRSRLPGAGSTSVIAARGIMILLHTHADLVFDAHAHFDFDFFYRRTRLIRILVSLSKRYQHKLPAAHVVRIPSYHHVERSPCSSPWSFNDPGSRRHRGFSSSRHYRRNSAADRAPKASTRILPKNQRRDGDGDPESDASTQSLVSASSRDDATGRYDVPQAVGLATSGADPERAEAPGERLLHLALPWVLGQRVLAFIAREDARSVDSGGSEPLPAYEPRE
ncbi:hypothetical protein VTO73DRAFT_9032 [Trametes versicolor]